MSVPVVPAGSRLLLVAAISESWTLRRRAPTYAELCAAAGLSRARVHHHLRRLRAAGIVTWDEGRNGTIRLTQGRAHAHQ